MKQDNKNWLDKFYTNLEKIESSEIVLQNLAYYFYKVGNSYIGNKLDNISFQLTNARIEINKAISESIDINFKASQQSSANMLKATLAGIQIEKDKNKKAY